jgi:hypothetical protein
MSWGKAIRNKIGWGQSSKNDIGYGSIYKDSNSGETETELTNQQEKNKEDDKK